MMHQLERIQAQARRFKSPTHIAKDLDLLSQLIKDMPKADLSNYSFLFIQHFLAAFPARLELMIKEGLNREKAWFLDIPYSTNAEVSGRIGDMFQDRIPAPYTDPFGNYTNDQLNRLDAVIDTVLQLKGKTPLVVIDDGSYFAKYLHQLWLSDPNKAHEFRGTRIVEQTTRGHRFLESYEGQDTLQRFDIIAVSVARTETKIQFEAPFIGVSIADSVIAKLESLTNIPQHVLVVGFGSVGSATAFALRSVYCDMQIDVIEVDSSKLEQAQKMGFGIHQSFKIQNPSYQYDLILGCTGQRAFKPSDKNILADSALLVSGSSAAVEFDRQNFVDQADIREDDDFRVITCREGPLPLHTDISFEHGSKSQTFTIVNAGFPVNFQGTLGVIPTELIEPTHCLMHAATVEAINTNRVGLTSLSEKWDQRIHDMARSVIDAKL